MSYEVSVVANYHKGEAFPFQLLIFLFTHNYLNTQNDFQEVWKQYPSKTGKKLALKYYLKWRNEEGHTNRYLLHRLDTYKNYLKLHDKQPVHGSTWFNGHFDDAECLTDKEREERYGKALTETEGTNTNWMDEVPF
ncbi:MULTISPECIES: hypothetical protein [Levilactobacillus]|uniref:hypothetical protein n=1 Tax=Levilactobacillus TaxID=2767886 RepID=UPI003757711E